MLLGTRTYVGKHDPVYYESTHIHKVLVIPAPGQAILVGRQHHHRPGPSEGPDFSCSAVQKRYHSSPTVSDNMLHVAHVADDNHLARLLRSSSRIVENLPHALDVLAGQINPATVLDTNEQNNRI